MAVPIPSEGPLTEGQRKRVTDAVKTYKSAHGLSLREISIQIQGLRSNTLSEILSGKYAMKVEEILSMSEYDTRTTKRLRGKDLDRRSKDVRRRVGDSIYDFSVDPPRIRPGIHDEGDRKRDLGGLHAIPSRR